MKINPALILIVFFSTRAFTCECANTFDNSFLGNIGSFDFIVKGKVVGEDFGSLTLIVEETYKGVVRDTIFIKSGFGCDNLMVFIPGEQIIVGLNSFDSPAYPDTFSSPGCVTSALFVEGQKVYAPQLQLPMFKRPKITIFRSRMSLQALERKIRRKVGS